MGLLAQLPDDQMFFMKCKAAVHCDCNKDLDRWLYRDVLRIFKKQLKEPEVYEKTQVNWLESTYPESRDHSQKYTSHTEINSKIVKNNKDALGEERIPCPIQGKERASTGKEGERPCPDTAQEPPRPIGREPPRIPQELWHQFRISCAQDRDERGILLRVSITVIPLHF